MFPQWLTYLMFFSAIGGFAFLVMKVLQMDAEGNKIKEKKVKRGGKKGKRNSRKKN